MSHPKNESGKSPFTLPLVIFAILTLLLGTIGFAQYYYPGMELHIPKSFNFLTYILKSFLSSIELLEGIFIYKPVEDMSKHHVPPLLLAARVFGVFVLSFAILKLFPNFVARVRRRFYKKHTLICGLGERSFNLIHELKSAPGGEKTKIVVLEKNPENAFIKDARAAGVNVLVGDATSQSALLDAGVIQASYVHIFLPDDNLSVAAALACHELRKKKNRFQRKSAEESTEKTEGYQRCRIHVQRGHSWEVFSKHELLKEADREREFYPQVIDENTIAAKYILFEYAQKIFTPFRDRPNPPHILIVGAGVLGQNLLLQMSHILHHGSHDEHGQALPLKVSVLDKNPVRKTEFFWQYPHLQFPEISFTPAFITGDITCLEKVQFDRILENGQVDGVLFCISDEISALSSARLLQSPNYFGESVPMVICADTGKGLAKFFDSQGNGSPNIFVHNLLAIPAKSFLEEKGFTDPLAEVLHNEYLKTQLSKLEEKYPDETRRQAEREENPSLKEWAYLDEPTRESNRQQAWTQMLKLRVMGYGFGGSDVEKSISEAHLETLGQMEHLRWMVEKFSAGYRYGVRDSKKKLNPYLVPWWKLEEIEAQEIVEREKKLGRKLKPEEKKNGIRVLDKNPARVVFDALQRTQK